MNLKRACDVVRHLERAQTEMNKALEAFTSAEAIGHHIEKAILETGAAKAMVKAAMRKSLYREDSP